MLCILFTGDQGGDEGKGRRAGRWWDTEPKKRGCDADGCAQDQAIILGSPGLRFTSAGQSGENEGMWNSFLADLIVAIFSSVLTVGIAYFTYSATRRSKEIEALNSLIRELHGRRVIAPIINPAEKPGAETSNDFAHAAASVISMKSEIRRARDNSRPIAKLQQPLFNMTKACNDYLEDSSAAPENYWFLLIELQRHLNEAVIELTKCIRGVEVLEPGTGAYKSS